MAEPTERPPVVARPGRRALVASVILGVAGAGLGVASILFDLGWAWWIVSLAAVGIAVVLALSGARASTLIGLVVAGAVVAGGIVAAGVEPPLPGNWTALPTFTTGDRVHEIGREDDVVVVMDDDRGALVGYSLDGRTLWSNEQANLSGDGTAVLAGDTVISYPANRDQGPAVAVATATGETAWSVQIDGAEPVSAGDEVIVFAGDEHVVALDRLSGAQVWERSGDYSASSEGASGFNPHRWTAEANWIVLGDPALDQFEVVDSRTGESASTGIDRSDSWVITGDTLVTFEYDSDEFFAVGTPLGGGEGWKTEIDDFDPTAFFEPVDGDLRIVHRSLVQWLDGEGELTTVELPTGWSINDVHSEIDGARSLVVEHRDHDHVLLGVGVFDSLTGDLTEIDGPYGGDPVVAGVTRSGTVVSLPYRDAVGDVHARKVLIPDPK